MIKRIEKQVHSIYTTTTLNTAKDGSKEYTPAICVCLYIEKNAQKMHGSSTPAKLAKNGFSSIPDDVYPFIIKGDALKDFAIQAIKSSQDVFVFPRNPGQTMKYKVINSVNVECEIEDDELNVQKIMVIPSTDQENSLKRKVELLFKMTQTKVHETLSFQVSGFTQAHIELDNVSAQLLQSICTNPNNRHINRAGSNRYRGDMNKGYWKLNGESIAFSPELLLLNGHHRLDAVGNAQFSVQFFCTFGITTTVFDDVLQRRLGHQLDMDGIHNVKAPWAQGLLCLFHDNFTYRASNAVKVAFISQYKYEIKSVTSIIGDSKNQTWLTRGTIVPAIIYATIIGTRYKDQILLFLKDLVSNRSINNAGVLYTHLSYLKETNKSVSASQDRDELAAQVLFVLQKFVEGVDIQDIPAKGMDGILPIDLDKAKVFWKSLREDFESEAA